VRRAVSSPSKVCARGPQLCSYPAHAHGDGALVSRAGTSMALSESMGGSCLDWAVGALATVVIEYTNSL
jgi:hypothetical protein